MAQSWRSWGWKLGLASVLVMGGASAISRDCAFAQIVPDATLGAERSVVTPNAGGVDVIQGGARRGANLFHSFEKFSVLTGRTAFFNNAVDIQNIISRVTGASISNIDGLIKANGVANLFLINPNGIIFGRNASLNIGGSFLASTASSLKFADGTQFSATSPQTTPLLTISVPIGLQFGANPGGIGVLGDGQGIRTTSAPIDTTAGLHVASNQTLAMIGGDVTLTGGTLKTAGGRIELGSVAGPSLVSLTPIDKGLALGYEGVQNFGDIKLSQQSAVDASGNGGGDIQVQGRQVTLTDGSRIEASTLGSKAGGTLSVNALDAVNLSGTTPDGKFPSALYAQVYSEATGAGGNLTVKTGQLNLRDGAEVSTSTYGQGHGGNLAVNASDSVEVSGTAPNGNLNFAPRGNLASGLFTQAEQGATGAAGDLTITTGKLTVQNGAYVSTSTYGQGHGGNLAVNASNSVELSGTSPSDQFATIFVSGLFTETFGTGAAGDLTITTGKLTIQNGAYVSTGTNWQGGPYGQGQGGNLAVNASDSVEVSGTAPNQGAYFVSGLFTTTSGTGAAGDLKIATGKLTVQNGAYVSTSTDGQGYGGNLAVNASDSVELSGTSPSGLVSGLFTQAEQGATGAAGGLTITTGKLTVQNGASVSAATFGLGNGGNIQINASGKLTVQNGASVSAATFDLGNSGNIQINVSNGSVDLSGVSSTGLSSGLFTNTYGVGQAGTITVNSSTVRIADGAVVDASTRGKGNITTNSNAFRGGTININANTFDVANGGQLRTTTEGTGRAGDITLKVLNNVTLEGRGSGIFANTATGSTGSGGSIIIDPNQLKLTDGARVAVDSLGIGKAGSLNVQANYLTLDRGTSLSAAAASGEGGIINLHAQDLLLMRHGSQISAVAGGTGNGGNITINTPFIVAVPTEQSDITANALQGRGGNVQITARNIFGIQPGNQDNSHSYIQASYNLEVNGLGINPSLGLVTLPVVPVDVTGLIAQGCPASVGPRASKFVVTGRGGLPPNPSAPLSSDTVWTDLRPRTRHAGNRLRAEAATPPTNSTQGQLVEAQGWVTNDKGEVVLVAQAPTVTPDIPWLRPTTCHMQ